MEISNLTLGRENRRIFQAKLLLPWVRNVHQKKRTRKRRKKNQSIKDWRKAKENRKEKKRFFGLDNVWTMCRIVEREKYKRRAIITWLRHGGCKVITCFSYQPNLCVRSCSALNQREKETEKGKAQTTKAKFPIEIQPYKVLLIHDDCAYYLWFDGKWDETLACVRFHTPWAVFLYSVGPSVSSNALLEMKC